MYMVTVEDENGMWWCEPVAADTAEEALAISERECARIPAGYERCLWKCTRVVKQGPPKTLGEAAGKIVPGLLPQSH